MRKEKMTVVGHPLESARSMRETSLLLSLFLSITFQLQTRPHYSTNNIRDDRLFKLLHDYGEKSGFVYDFLHMKKSPTKKM